MSEKRTKSDKAQRHADQLENKAFRRPDQNQKKHPHLTTDGKLQRCSVCGYPFEPDVQPSMSVAFADHLSKAHQPGQTSEDVNQAAARIVREATEK